MPRTETITRVLYTFEELCESAKQKALEEFYYINVDCDWWNFVYSDANENGITINEFDIDRNRHCKTTIFDCENTANLIIENHGKKCETYKTAKEFINEYKPLKTKLKKCNNIYERRGKDNHGLDNLIVSLERDIENLKDDFKKSISEDYAIMLQKEYEYLMSEECIKETILANEYEFTEDGKLI